MLILLLVSKNNNIFCTSRRKFETNDIDIKDNNKYNARRKEKELMLALWESNHDSRAPLAVKGYRDDCAERSNTAG